MYDSVYPLTMQDLGVPHSPVSEADAVGILRSQFRDEFERAAKPRLIRELRYLIGLKQAYEGLFAQPFDGRQADMTQLNLAEKLRLLESAAAPFLSASPSLNSMRVNPNLG